MHAYDCMVKLSIGIEHRSLSILACQPHDLSTSLKGNDRSLIKFWHKFQVCTICTMNYSPGSFHGR